MTDALIISLIFAFLGVVFGAVGVKFVPTARTKNLFVIRAMVAVMFVVFAINFFVFAYLYATIPVGLL